MPIAGQLALRNGFLRLKPMAIDYFGHYAGTPKEAQRRLDHVRAARPDWFGAILILYDAQTPPEPFGRETSREFGIEAQSRFMLSVNDKERFTDVLSDALELLYETFGTDGFVLTWGLDFIHLPRALHPGVAPP